MDLLDFTAFEAPPRHGTVEQILQVLRAYSRARPDLRSNELASAYVVVRDFKSADVAEWEAIGDGQIAVPIWRCGKVRIKIRHAAIAAFLDLHQTLSGHVEWKWTRDQALIGTDPLSVEIFDRLPVRLKYWLAAGQRNAATDTMCRHIFGFPPQRSSREDQHPTDPDDLTACLTFIAAVPEAGLHLNRLSVVSAQWRAIVDAWGELATLHNRNWHACYLRLQEVLRESGADACVGIEAGRHAA